MNWMIDGLYGDLYRTAMGYRELRPLDEWEIERLGKTSAAPAQPAAARVPVRIGSWLGRLASQLRGIIATLHDPERKPL